MADSKAQASSADDSGSAHGKSHSNGSSLLLKNTLRHPQWTYFHLSLFGLGTQQPALDVITARQHLTSALSRFLGLTGAAIPVDIMKLEASDLWLRIPRENASAFHEAIASWIGQNQIKYIVRGKDEWLVKLLSGTGSDLFDADDSSG